ncbi:MAG TPA: HAD family hydrolase [Candidatus Pristimantibacillus sp.]|jgi:FMN phosphatase YigB (HAD superfamily)|nr:HAD family hydrolase [Candidatus Pristimantibacillus sp.]
MISFVYFDVGGVVVDDFYGNNKWDELRQELGITAANRAVFQKIWSRYAPELCVDRDVETLLPILSKELGLRFPKDYSLLNGFVSRFYANPDIWPVIEYTRDRAAIGLLTNMYPGMYAAIERKGILPDVKWDVVIDSSVELLQKPDSKLFELASKKAGVPNGEILFVDNGPEHINAAKAFGWQTFLYDSSDHKSSIEELKLFLQERLVA